MIRPLLALLLAALATSLDAQQLLPGQLIIDSLHPQTFRRFGEGPVFLCGPGDPEGFLYRGTLNADGTRDGDQMELIAKLGRHGGNCLYLQAVRSHGGDGEATHNPFVGHDPARGLNDLVLGQWNSWFELMKMRNILVYFFFYDDSADPWKSGREVTEAERRFVVTLVRRFMHHPNLIWIVAEESEEALHPARARRLGEIIRDADEYRHPIGNHHHSGADFKSWTSDAPFNHYAMQLNVPLNQVHSEAIRAAEFARGRYQVLWAENTEIEDTESARLRFAWECAMGGLMPMLLNMNIADTPPESLQACRILSGFFEQSQFQELRPAEDHAAAGTQHVLANPTGTIWIAYGSAVTNGAAVAVKNLPSGTYDWTWLDCLSGETRRGQSTVQGEFARPKPDGFGPMAAVRLARLPERVLALPGADWERRDPDEAGLDAGSLKEFAALAGGRGVIICDGYLVHQWGDIEKPGDLASASKPLYSHLLLAAWSWGKLALLDQKLSGFYPCLSDLNAGLGFKDREVTLRHLAFQTACLGYREPPGSAFDYNDHTMGLFWDVVMTKIYSTDWTRADSEVFSPLLADPLELQDGIHFPTSGRMAGRPRMSPRDFARFGLLYLNGGTWKGHVLIPASVTRLAVTDPLPLTMPRTAGVEADRCATRSIGGGGNQTDHNGGYSWLWWVNGVARDGQRWWKDAPPNMYAALGHCGQRGLAVFPDQRIVVSWNDSKELHCDRELGNRAFGLLIKSVRQ